MTQNTKHPSLSAALVAAQAELENPAFDAANPHFKNRFASLGAFLKAIIPIYNRHGIAFVQNLIGTDTGVGCETVLIHESRETLRFGPLTLPASKLDAQGFGSAATYARRYSAQAVAGLVGEVDDDANSAVRAHEDEKDRAALWNPPSQRKHYYNEILRMWGANDPAGLRQLADELSSEQQVDLWGDFQSTQRREIKALLAQTAAKQE